MQKQKRSKPKRTVPVPDCPNRVVQGGLSGLIPGDAATDAKGSPPNKKQKRSRPKCSFPNCPKSSVKGGVCISHGARRRTCSYPGCEKIVKKSGLCSAHGPARKECEDEHGSFKCPKVAVQGGRCVEHGANRKKCDYEFCSVRCTKVAVSGGRCIRHGAKRKRDESTTPESTQTQNKSITLKLKTSPDSAPGSVCIKHDAGGRCLGHEAKLNRKRLQSSLAPEKVVTKTKNETNGVSGEPKAVGDNESTGAKNGASSGGLVRTTAELPATSALRLHSGWVDNDDGDRSGHLISLFNNASSDHSRDGIFDSRLDAAMAYELMRECPFNQEDSQGTPEQPDDPSGDVTKQPDKKKQKKSTDSNSRDKAAPKRSAEDEPCDIKRQIRSIDGSDSENCACNDHQKSNKKPVEKEEGSSPQTADSSAAIANNSSLQAMDLLTETDNCSDINMNIQHGGEQSREDSPASVDSLAAAAKDQDECKSPKVAHSRARTDEGGDGRPHPIGKCLIPNCVQQPIRNDQSVFPKCSDEDSINVTGNGVVCITYGEEFNGLGSNDCAELAASKASSTKPGTTSVSAKEDSSQHQQTIGEQDGNDDDRGGMSQHIVWKCAICMEAVFDSYDECVAHEKGCVGAVTEDEGLTASRIVWTCDICKRAVFNSYNECDAHEKGCAGVVEEANKEDEGGTARRIVWTCNVCKRAVFDSFDDCVAHETYCFVWKCDVCKEIFNSRYECVAHEMGCAGDIQEGTTAGRATECVAHKTHCVGNVEKANVTEGTAEYPHPRGESSAPTPAQQPIPPRVWFGTTSLPWWGTIPHHTGTAPGYYLGATPAGWVHDPITPPHYHYPPLLAYPPVASQSLLTTQHGGQSCEASRSLGAPAAAMTNEQGVPERCQSLEGDTKKRLNERCSTLARDQCDKLRKEDLAAQNARRRERASVQKTQQMNVAQCEQAAVKLPHTPNADKPITKIGHDSRGHQSYGSQRTRWSEEEDRVIFQAQRDGVISWTNIAKQLPGRSDNAIRKRWNGNMIVSGFTVAEMKGNKGSQCTLAAPWSEDEDRVILQAQRDGLSSWATVAKQLPGRADNAVRNHWYVKMRSKLESYLMSKNIDGVRKVKDNRGRYLIGDDIEGCLGAVRCQAQNENEILFEKNGGSSSKTKVTGIEIANYFEGCLSAARRQDQNANEIILEEGDGSSTQAIVAGASIPNNSSLQA